MLHLLLFLQLEKLESSATKAKWLFSYINFVFCACFS